jgi:3'(2'), 5'-bisphosphate nucleotidase
MHAQLEPVIAMAREAADVINDVVDNHDLETVEKEGGQGPVTAADLAADELLRDRLAKAFPDDAVITEETWDGSDIAAYERVWFVDPLDGTRELVKRTGDYAVMIGLAVGGEPALGVVCQPTTGKLWAGSVPDRVCFAEHRPGERHDLDISARPVGDPVRLAVSRSHRSALAREAEEELGATAIEKGSVGLKVGMLVDDEADVYLSGSRRMKVWDTCGPAAILLAAGGVIEAVDGRPLVYVGPAAHGAGLRAFSPATAAAWRPKIDEAVARWRARQR